MASRPQVGPLRARNDLLLAAGFAPAFAQNDLDAPEIGPARRHWGMLAANRAVAALLEGVAPWLLEPPVNVEFEAYPGDHEDADPHPPAPLLALPLRLRSTDGQGGCRSSAR